MNRIALFLHKRIVAFIIISLMVLGFILRTYYLKQNNIVFGYDQARDAYIASQIAHGDLKILGPPVSFGNLYHGVIYYYIIALPYHLSQGNPILPIYFLVVLNILTIPLVYLTAKQFFDQKIAILSALFYTVSFDIIQYSNWLSNPSLSIPFSTILFLGIATFLSGKNKKLAAFLIGIGYALSFQSEFFLGYLLIPLICSFYFLKIKVSKKQILIFTLTAIIFLSPMILSYLKFGQNSIQGLQTLFANNDQFNLKQIDFFPDFKMFFVRLVENFNRTVFPFKSIFTFIFVIFSFVFFIKNYQKTDKATHGLLVCWIFLISQIIIIPFGGDYIPYLNAGFELPAILISSWFINYLFQNKHRLISVFLILSFIFFSLLTNFKYNPKTQILNDISSNMTIKNELNAIDYTYQDSHGQPFSINTVTTPYWINTLWSYLYQWHGQQKYGYTPSFHGRDQSGQLSYLSQEIFPKTNNYYLIIESTKESQSPLINDTILYEDTFSNVIDTKFFDGIIVQKRQLTKPLNQINFIK